MSSTTSAPPAPWRDSFLEHIAKLKTPEFVLSTLHASSASSSVPHLPRARYCIYRGLWASLPPNDRNPAPRNPATYASDLPTITTDARMDKTADLFATSPTHPTTDLATVRGASGGGGPLEAVYWIPDAGAQWRVRGAGWIVAPDIDGDGAGAVATRTAVGKYLRPAEGETAAGAEWSWARELAAHFGNVSPGMRGSFRNPVPGSPVRGEPDREAQLGQKVADLEDARARENFRVLVIVPEEVERLDLEDPAKARRRRWTLREEGGKLGDWTEEELWP